MANDAADDLRWVDKALSGGQFKDARLGKRLTELMRRMSGKAGTSIPLACQDWAKTKAAYQFFANERVDEQAIWARPYLFFTIFTKKPELRIRNRKK